MHIKHRAERNVVLADRSAKTVQHNIRHKNSKPSGATNAGVLHMNARFKALYVHLNVNIVSSSVIKIVK